MSLIKEVFFPAMSSKAFIVIILTYTYHCIQLFLFKNYSHFNILKTAKPMKITGLVGNLLCLERSRRITHALYKMSVTMIQEHDYLMPALFTNLTIFSSYKLIESNGKNHIQIYMFSYIVNSST